MEEINLYELLRFYRKHWLKIVIITLAGLALAAGYTHLLQKPVYESKATLIAVGTADNSAQGSAKLNNYTQLFTSRRVLEPVVRDQHVPYATLAPNVKATNDKGSELIRLAVTGTDAQSSQKLANGIIDSFRKEVKAIYGNENVGVVDDASLPPAPANVRPTMQYALGVAGGLMLSLLGLFFAFDYAHSKMAGLTASERLVFQKTRQAEEAQKLVAKLEAKNARAARRRERRAAFRAQWAALFKRWSELRAQRANERAERRKQRLEARAKRADTARKQAEENQRKADAETEAKRKEQEAAKEAEQKKNMAAEEAKAQETEAALREASQKEAEANKRLRELKRKRNKKTSGKKKALLANLHTMRNTKNTKA